MKLALLKGREMDLGDSKQIWLAASKSDGRGGLHFTGTRHWIVCCCYVLGIDPFPDARLMRRYEYQLAYEGWLEDFFEWVIVAQPSGASVSAVSAGKYVSTARGAYRTMRRARLGLEPSASRIPDLIKGCSRTIPQPPKLERWGVSPDDLARAWEALGCRRVWRAATATALIGIMRGCEVALMDGEAFAASEHLLPADVQFEGRGPTRDELRVRLRMRKRKDLHVLRGKHDSVILAAAADAAFFDVVGELEAWLAERRAMGIPESAALFCHDDGSAITVRELRDMVKALMQSIGLDPARFGAHSLRIGGASAALAAGVPPALIRIMGRWSSDAYEVYCRMSTQAAMGVGRAIAASATDPLERRQFHSEYLELLDSEVAEAYGPAPGDDERDVVVEED